MRRVFSVLFWTFFGVSSLACYLTALVIWVVTLPFDRQRRLNHYFSCFWASLYAWIYPGWRVRVTGRDRIDRSKAYVLVANHTSIADIVLMFCVFRQFKWVSKTEVFNYPLLGWNMRLCRYIPLVRGNQQSIARMMLTSRDWLRAKMSIVMFPEGTRSKDGLLKPFKHGAFTLAMESGVAVVPIAIHGGADLIAKHQKTFATRAELWVEVLDPIPPDGFADAGAYAVAVRERLRAALGQPASELAPQPAVTEAA